ncbi:MAG: hypothetical protein EBX92_08685 [Actinobacteria bacterium]|nr:hypothetical protein [Actinomycetota bacterium]
MATSAAAGKWRSKARISLLCTFLIAALAPVIAAPAWSSTCTQAPKAPKIKTIWNGNDGPKFIVTPDQSGEMPTSLASQYALQKFGAKEPGEYTEWQETEIYSQEETIEESIKLNRDYQWVFFSAKATNECGYMYVTIVMPMLTAKNLSLANLRLAKNMPVSVSKISGEYFLPSGYSIPQDYLSLTPKICEFKGKENDLTVLDAGVCKVKISQKNSEVETSNPDFTTSINFIPTRKVLPKTTKNRADESKAPTIHVVYTTVKGIKSKGFLESGDISNWLDLANLWMSEKLGKKFNFDTYQGAYDISIMDSGISSTEIKKFDLIDPSKKSKAEPILTRLWNRYKKQNGGIPKNQYLLFVFDAELSKKYCGLGEQPGRVALAQMGGKCWDAKRGYLAQISRINSASQTIAHELIHNTGVGHPCSVKSDLMIGSGCAMAKGPLEITLDEKRKMYVGTAKAGANIVKAKFWQ